MYVHAVCHNNHECYLTVISYDDDKYNNSIAFVSNTLLIVVRLLFIRFTDAYPKTWGKPSKNTIGQYLSLYLQTCKVLHPVNKFPELSAFHFFASILVHAVM